MAYEGNINETKYVIDTDNIDPVSFFSKISYLLTFLNSFFNPHYSL